MKKLLKYLLANSSLIKLITLENLPVSIRQNKIKKNTAIVKAVGCSHVKTNKTVHL